MTQRRLIEQAFPLKQVSEDSRHEKNVRHGHISTLHIWPARRPLAACRAALIAALLPDPGDEAGRKELCDKITRITHWGTENGPELDFFRREIRKAFGGRAPRVLDPFAGGGAIPLEALRLGCDVVANDYNSVAWFILKCTLEFPQRLAGKTWPLPGKESRIKNQESGTETGVVQLGFADSEFADSEIQGDLATHVRYWGNWVLERARAELEPYYPTINDQPTVAYLWARTVPCPDPACGATVPLLKTLWLCKKPKKRRALRIVLPSPSEGEGPGVRVSFEIWKPGPRDEVPPGTMQGAKSRCPCCGAPLTPDYIKACGHEGKMGAQMTAVVVDTGNGKEYRLPMPEDLAAAEQAKDALAEVASQVPYGIPDELQQQNPRTFIVQLYGMNTWASLFSPRQLLSLLIFLRATHLARIEMKRSGYSDEWIEALTAYLGIVLDKVADYNSSLCTWHNSGELIGHTYARFALPMAWDYVELPLSNDVGGAYNAQLDWVARYVEHALNAVGFAQSPTIISQTAVEPFANSVDLVVTDPPYYNAIPYADISDFFYVWLRRSIGDMYPEKFTFATTQKDKELALRLPHTDIPDEHTSEWYEQMMGQAFRRMWEALNPDGKMVIVFAHKDAEAWERLVVAMINAGFTVVASWPIDTEMGTRTRARDSAALASSIWLVCRKRSADAGVGRYGAVRRAMQERITERLRYFWDIGISGPDFVWAAVGPALEAYSAYDAVRRLDGTPFTVSDFLKEVRRLVADFALGQILKGHSTEGLDEWTRYYLIHRSHFGMEGAPVGEAILLSQGYGLDLNELRGPRGFLVSAGGSAVRLAKWEERTRLDLGNPHPGGGLPLVDMLQRLMWLWTSGEMAKFRTYVDDRGLARNDLFWAVAQAILEMSAAKSKERALLEAIVAWGRGKGPEEAGAKQTDMFWGV